MKNKQRIVIGLWIGIFIVTSGLTIFLSQLLQPMEDETEMTEKYKEFQLVSNTNDDLEDIQNIRNIHEYNDTLYFGKTTAAPGPTVYAYSTPNSLIGSTTEEDSISTNYGSIGNTIVTRGWDNDIWIAWGDLAGSPGGGDEPVYAYAKSLDGGDTWTDGSYHVSGLSDASSVPKILDIVHEGSDIYAVYCIEEKTAGNYRVYFWKNFTTAHICSIHPDTKNSVYAGKMDEDGNYTFVIYDGSNFKKVTVDLSASSDSSETITGPSVPTAWNVNAQQYWTLGGIEWLMDEDQFLVTEDSWENSAGFTDTGTTTNAIVWGKNSSDEYVPLFVIWKDSIYKILNSNKPVYFGATTADAFTGFTDWFTNGSDSIYQLDYTTISNVQEAKFFSKIMGPSYGIIRSTDEPNIDQYYEIYDENNDLLIADYVSDYVTDSQMFVWYFGAHPKVKEPNSSELIDLNTKVYESYSSKTAHYILKDILDSYCSYFYYDAGIDDSPATTYDKDFTDKTVKDVFKWADEIQGYQISWRKDHEIYWDDYTLPSWDYKLAGGRAKTGVVQTSGGLSDWTNNSYLSIESTNLNHENVLYFKNTSGSSIQCRLTFTGQTSGVIEWFMGDFEVNWGSIYIFNQAGQICIQIIQTSTTNIRVYHAATSTNVTVSADELSHIRVEFDCATDTQTVDINSVNIITDQPFNGSQIATTLIQFGIAGDASVGIKVDGIGFSWDGLKAFNAGAMIGDTSAHRRMPVKKPIRNKYGRYMLKGGYADGERVQANILKVPGQNTYIDEDSSILTTAGLEAWATALHTNKYISIDKYKMEVVGDGYFNPGSEIIVSLLQYTLQVETLYCIESNYDNLTKSCMIILTSALWLPPVKEETQSKVQNVELNVAGIESSVNNPSGIGITPRMVTFTNQTAPDDPATGEAVLYVDENGDLIIKINVGGSVKTATLADYSAL